MVAWRVRRIQRTVRKTKNKKKLTGAYHRQNHFTKECKGSAWVSRRPRRLGGRTAGLLVPISWVRVSPSAYSGGLFLASKNGERKAREGELATTDENRRAVGMLNPLRDENEGPWRGREGTTPVTTPCPEDDR